MGWWVGRVVWLCGFFGASGSGLGSGCFFSSIHVLRCLLAAWSESLYLSRGSMLFISFCDSLGANVLGEGKDMGLAGWSGGGSVA